MSIVQTAVDVRGTALQGAVGAWAAHSDNDRWGSGFNQNPQAAQVGTIVVGGATSDKTYTVTINSVDVSYLSDGSATVAEIADGLADAINAEPLVRGQVAAVSDGIDTVTITGLTPGLAFTASDADAQLTTTEAVTAADSADPIPVGRAVVSQGAQSGEAEELVALAASSLFDAQVITATVVNGGATTRAIRIHEVRGSERVLLAETVFAGSATEATEAAAIIAAANLALPANTVLAGGAGANVTFTAEVAGLEFDVEIEQVNAGDITFAATTGPSPDTSLVQALAGVSMRPLDEEVTTIGGTDPEFPANAGVRFAKEGKLWVESAEAITHGATVYVELGVSADNGQFFLADSATRLALPKALARWERAGNVSADNLAVLRLNIP